MVTYLLTSLVAQVEHSVGRVGVSWVGLLVEFTLTS